MVMSYHCLRHSSERPSLGILIKPRNPRTTPTKSTINIASAKLGMVRNLPFSWVPTIRTPPPLKKPPDQEGLLWGWCVVGGPLF